MGLYDSWQRPINSLRISITDRCNLNCIYCSVEPIPGLSHNDLLTYEEITSVARAAAMMGICKIRITGGEPLMRPHVSRLVNMLAQINGIDNISLTTNAILLSKYADELKGAGLKGVNISLNTLQADKYKRIAGDNKLEDVLKGIEASEKAGLNPVKINIVVLRGINDDEILDFARKSISTDWNVRFIEYMPFTSREAEVSETVSTQEIQERIQSIGKLEPYTGKITGSGPAKYYRLPGAKGTIGFISPMTEQFCSSCNRLRLTFDGKLRPCLLDDSEIDLKDPLRKGASEDEIRQLIEKAAILKREGHCLSAVATSLKRKMYQIGG